MPNLPLLAFSLLFCGSLSLTGCGVATRLHGFNDRQAVIGTFSPVKEGLKQTIEIKQLATELAQTPAPTGSVQAQPQVTATLSDEDQALLEQAKRRRQELLELENTKNKIRDVGELQEELEKQLRRGRQVSLLQSANAQLVRQYLTQSPEGW